MVARLASVAFGGVPRVVDLAALPKVAITTTAGAPIDSLETYVAGTITVTGAGPVATRAAQFRGRGNSTWPLPKKPYRIKLGAAASLIPGVAKSKDWVLLANYYDPSSLRGAVAFEIGRRATGLDWTPTFQHVEVTLNGVPVGLYQLGEHVKIDPARVAIDSMGSGDTIGAALTGGYTLEIDQRYIDAGDPGFTTPHGVMIALDDPDGTVAAQAGYIEDYIAAFEAALYGTNWLDPTTGYAPFIDRDSFIDWYLIEELLANTDSGFYSSCKLYKPRSGPLHMGPIWDFDLSLGRQFGTDAQRDPQQPYTRTGATWYQRLFEDPAFVDAAGARWAALKADLVGADPIAGFIDAQHARIVYAARRDRDTWGRAVTGIDTPEELKAWLTRRMTWMDTQFAEHTFPATFTAAF